MKRLLSGFVRLSGRDQLFFLTALFLAAFLRVYIKFRGFNQAVKLLLLFNVGEPSAGNTLNLERYSKSITLSYCFSPYVNCLAICTAHWWLMKRRGTPVQMKFGMVKRNEKLTAHSWLEYNGEAFAEDINRRNRFTAFERSIL